MPAPREEEWQTRCVPHQASFALQAKIRVTDPKHPLWISVEADELLQWTLVAAEYDGRFHAELLKHLGNIQHQQPGS